MLGKLAKYLLMLGIDALYFRQNNFAQLVELAKKQRRIILTRDTKLRKVKNLPGHLFITDDLPGKQFRQVVEHFGLKIDETRLFTRCLQCNRKLTNKIPEEVKPLVPSYIFTTHQKFSFCPQCKKVYWKGSHQKRMEEIIRGLLEFRGRGLGDKDE